jgi:hypothetical protein
VKTLTSLQLGAAELVVFCSLGTLLNGPLFAVVLALLPGGLLLNELWHLEEGMEEEHHSNYLAHVQRCNILEQGAKGAADAVVVAMHLTGDHSTCRHVDTPYFNAVRYIPDVWEVFQ